MRRGRPGFGGWRNDNPRHFRSRGGGTPHFPPGRGYGLLESPRFRPSGPRPQMGPHYTHPPPLIDDHMLPEHDSNNYHSRHNDRPHDRRQYGQQKIFPHLQHMRHGDGSHSNPFNSTPNYYDDNNAAHINSMGDVDLRHSNNESFHPPSPWVNPPPQYFEQRGHNKPFRHEMGDANKLLSPDYAGHRPPTSDQYGSIPSSAIDNSNSFSRSVDDTVDIVRKRLLNRDSQPESELASRDETDDGNQAHESSSSYSNIQQEQPTKKKILKQKQPVKLNCDKIKSKIVHQLFKMDKGKIHKLMDNPNSSTKFEFAISSLVTESQNSFNRHMRSVAEQSLCISSTEFINNDNNTIYEDTFMKQMQCILDPQDTILLEDIKPMVLAELSKALQLGDLDDLSNYTRDDHPNEPYAYEDYPTYGNDPNAYYDQHQSQSDYGRSENAMFDGEMDKKYEKGEEKFAPEPLFERRQARKSADYSRSRRESSDSHRRRKERRSTDVKPGHNRFRRCESPQYEDLASDDMCKRKSRSPGLAFDHQPREHKFRRSGTPLPVFDNNDDKFGRSPIQDIVDKPSDDAFRISGTAQLYDDKTKDDKFGRSASPLQHIENKTREIKTRRSGTPLPEFDNNDDKFGRSGNPVPLFGQNEDKFERTGSPLPLFDNQPREPTFPRSGTPIPVFDAHAEILSEDDDPFAELDKQYHVAVDHNFIANDDLVCSQPISSHRPKTPAKVHTPKVSTYIKPRAIKPTELKSPEVSHKIKEEIDNQLQNMAKSPLKFISPVNVKNRNELVKQELLAIDSDDSAMTTSVKKVNAEFNILDDTNLQQQEHQIPEPKVVDDTTEQSESSGSMIKSTTLTNSRKRSIDQRPSHRKEKRKKSESGQSDTNKQILNKNIIINVNDCAAKSDKCDAPKSIFNLFFSKDKSEKEVSNENKKCDSTDRGYTDKYVKRKEVPKKKEKEFDARKKHDSTSSSHSIVSPTDNSNTNVSSQVKSEVIKLKPIDMFGDLSKKANTHQAHRNTAPAPTVNKTIIEVKKPFILQTGRKLSRRHIATQVVRKCTTKETQTLESKRSISRFCQTERKKLITRSAQTDPVAFKPSSSNKSGDFERMKEIDMEIQALLQEKFKLYSSLESKDSCPMQSLGMTVLNVSSVDGPKEEPDEVDNSLSEDEIVNDFTNIPQDELEKIALEAVEEQNRNVNVKETRNKRLKIVQQERTSSTSPTTKKSKKKSKSPNFSLIEQIITDDRPLEDIISLDDLESTPAKSKKKKTQPKPKKKPVKKAKTVQARNKPYHLLRECSVAIVRADYSSYLKPKEETKALDNISEMPALVENAPVRPESNIEDSIDNDNHLQFDMLDVSEDIVIGDMCEVKSSGDKDVNDMSTASISEEIILDNSQSSMEDAAPETQSSDECKIYDYSLDEILRRDAVTVSGNGDAVLAIECIGTDFIAACLDGNVYHFSGDGHLLNTLRGSNLAVTCLTIVKEKYGVTVYTGSLDSRIRYYDLETGYEKGPECNVLSPIQTMDRAWDTVFVGTRTGFVLQFECKNNMLIPVSTVKFSDQSILALRAMKEGPRKVLLVAARSESVTIKDAQTGLLLRTLEGPKMTVYTLLFEDGKVYCGTSSHQIHIFDYASGSHVGAHEGGKGTVCLRSSGSLVFAGCYDGCVYVYRDGDTRPVAVLRGPSLMLLSLAIVGNKIIAGYKDRSLHIWKIPNNIMEQMIL